MQLVFLVDDDALVLAVTRRVLMRAGYEVVTFDDPRHVSSALTRNPFAVVADLNMPDLDGPGLLALVREQAPHAYRVLYTGEGQPEELALPDGLVHAVLSKTASMKTLPDTLAQLRDR